MGTNPFLRRTPSDRMFWESYYKRRFLAMSDPCDPPPEYVPSFKLAHKHDDPCDNWSFIPEESSDVRT